MNRIRILAGLLLVALARPSSAAPIEAIVGFESLPPRLFTVDPRRFGGSFILATDNGIGLTVEAVDFTAAGIAGDFPDGFPESYPDGSGKYLAHGRQSLMPFTPVGKKGYSLRLGDDSNPRRTGDLFDLVSMDITNFARTSSTSLEYHPATVQFNTQLTPAAYTRGTEANGWESLSTPGNLTHTVGKIKFENVPVSDSTDAAFPANQFRGIRNAFIGLDDIRGVDNVKVRWSHENFNVPAAVNIMQQELTGPGVMADGTAVFHRPAIEASGNSGPIDVTSTERRVFTWDSDPLTTAGLPVRVAGELQFHYVAENGGVVQVGRSYTFRQIGKSTGTGSGFMPFTAPATGRLEGDIDMLTTEFFEQDNDTGHIVPGAQYELTTTLHVTVDPHGGYAAAFFDRGWEVRIAGASAVPEPATSIVACFMMFVAVGSRTSGRCNSKRAG